MIAKVQRGRSGDQARGHLEDLGGWGCCGGTESACSCLNGVAATQEQLAWHVAGTGAQRGPVF